MQRGERGSIGAVVAVAACAAVVGALLGWGVTSLARPEPVRADLARPLAAVSPSAPTYAPEQPYSPDVAFAALQAGLTYRLHKVGAGAYAWRYAVPTGWVTSVIGPGERKAVPPDNPVGSYGMRVELVLGQRLAPASLVEEKLAAFRSLFQDVHVLQQTSDTIAMTYRDPEDNWLRHNTFRWFADDNGTAAVELSVAGRGEDVPGLADLLDQVSASIEPVG